MKSWEKIRESFQCPKCRGKNAAAHRVTLSRTSVSQLLPLNPGKYIFLTCALCGYTEVYDLSVYAGEKKQLKNEHSAAQEA